MILNLKQKYNLNPGCILTAHLMQWFIPGNTHSQHTGVSYDSRDLRTIARQISLAQKLGVDAFLVDWYGPASVNADGDLAFKNLLMLAEILGNFRVGICIDKGAVKNVLAATPAKADGSPGMTVTAAFKVCYDYINQTYASYPAFFKDYILNFGCGAMGVDFTGFTNMLHDDSKYGKYFTWVGLPSGAASIASHYADPNCVMGSVAYKFDDYSLVNPTVSIWGGAARRMNTYGLSDNWDACWKAVPPSMKYLQIVTWNDYEERTAIEGAVGLV